eukprot:TRINITY_DN1157_c1_g1_i17.p2 TRINITY_DN1157_c1_g1~~TRINITY_DN1157_c1_g1_i17.p2  ORF type:complete len:100 (+),score=6.47 TRINITY_DN1157_c1_g1_i17:1096-1395(+)
MEHYQQTTPLLMSPTLLLGVEGQATQRCTYHPLGTSCLEWELYQRETTCFERKVCTRTSDFFPFVAKALHSTQFYSILALVDHRPPLSLQQSHSVCAAG